MERVNRLMAIFRCELLGLLDGFLGFLGKFVKSERHIKLDLLLQI